MKAGDIIGKIDQFEYLQRLEQAKTNVKRTSIELEDALIAYGGSASTASIPDAIRENAAIRTGYTAAQSELKTAQFDLEHTLLKAPFAGKIANLKQRAYEMVNTGEAFCTLIDDSAFEVEFHLIESEVGDVSLNDEVQVIPFSNPEVSTGRVTEINPLIDENGLVLVKALVKNSGTLWEGMNVKVLIRKAEPGHLVVPKSAVVLRQNQEVLFKYTNGSAYWTYVNTLLENSSSYSVIAHPEKGGELNARDTIIISNNINLAHESPVRVR